MGPAAAQDGFGVGRAVVAVGGGDRDLYRLLDLGGEKGEGVVRHVGSELRNRGGVTAAGDVEEADAGLLHRHGVALGLLDAVAAAQELAAMQAIEQREILAERLLDAANGLQREAQALFGGPAPCVGTVVEDLGQEDAVGAAADAENIDGIEARLGGEHGAMDDRRDHLLDLFGREVRELGPVLAMHGLDRKEPAHAELRVGDGAITLDLAHQAGVVRDVTGIVEEELLAAAGAFDEIGVDDADADQAEPAFGAGDIEIHAGLGNAVEPVAEIGVHRRHRDPVLHGEAGDRDRAEEKGCEHGITCLSPC